jgi:hypothetical protein
VGTRPKGGHDGRKGYKHPRRNGCDYRSDEGEEALIILTRHWERSLSSVLANGSEANPLTAQGGVQWFYRT